MAVSISAGVRNAVSSLSSIQSQAQAIQGRLATGKRVCVVSSELHGRDPTAAWQVLRPLAGHPNLMLCTDVPEKAQAYFKEA